MYTNDMARKMSAAMEKVKKAIEAGNGHTILSTGITGDDARMAKAVVDAGIKMLEPNHPAVALARGYKGVTTMHEAEQVRYGITVAQTWLGKIFILLQVFREDLQKFCPCRLRTRTFS